MRDFEHVDTEFGIVPTSRVFGGGLGDSSLQPGDTQVGIVNDGDDFALSHRQPVIGIEGDRLWCGRFEPTCEVADLFVRRSALPPSPGMAGSVEG